MISLNSVCQSRGEHFPFYGKNIISSGNVKPLTVPITAKISAMGCCDEEVATSNKKQIPRTFEASCSTVFTINRNCRRFAVTLEIANGHDVNLYILHPEMSTNSYHTVFIETYPFSGSGSRHSVRARPLAGQGYSTSMNVECSSKMREKHPVGTVFRISATLTNREGGTPFLFSHHSWRYSIVPRAEAEQTIASPPQEDEE